MAIKSPVDVVDLTLSLVVKVSGTIIPDSYPLISIEIHHEVNSIPYAELIFADGAVETGAFQIGECDSFVPGNKIEILAGYNGEDKSSIFNGVIVKQRVEVGGDNIFKLMLSCKDEAVGMTFNPTELESNAEPVLRLAFGESIQSFNAESSMFTGAPTEKSEIEVNADASLLKRHQSTLKGNVSFQGNGSVLPGKLVLLEGVGSRFSGNVFVSSVNHYIEDGIWKTTAGFGLNEVPIEAQLPEISGLQIATVKGLFDDPQSLHRIQVSLNSSGDDNWARVSNFYATENAGSGFLPEVGDEVVVGFLDSNPHSLIVLGSLYSSSNAPAYSAKDNNNYIKSIITRGKLKVSFNDEKKVMILETPGGNSIALDDENKKIIINDQNGNVICMDSNGISMVSEKNISLKARGDISLNAGGKIEVSAKEDAVVSGRNVHNKAQVGFVAKGGATAEIGSSGQTTIKGAMVMIN